MTFADDILSVAGDEPIESIVISEGRGWSDDTKHAAGRLMTWAEAKPFLEYEYDRGFGGQDCHNFYAWTATRVLGVSEYDGSTGVTSVPRNPTAGEPQTFS